MESGNVAQFKGKTLDEIDINLDEAIVDDDDAPLDNSTEERSGFTDVQKKRKGRLFHALHVRKYVK